MPFILWKLKSDIYYDINLAKVFVHYKVLQFILLFFNLLEIFCSLFFSLGMGMERHIRDSADEVWPITVAFLKVYHLKEVSELS